MTEYRVVLDGLHQFGVEVSSIGVFRSVRGFATEAAALAWVAAQEILERDAEGNGASAS
jgi:hypothetical protein